MPPLTQIDRMVDGGHGVSSAPDKNDGLPTQHAFEATASTRHQASAELTIASEVPVVECRRGTRNRTTTKIFVPTPGTRPQRPTKRRIRPKKVQPPTKWRVAFVKDRVTTASGKVLYRVLWRSRKYGRHPRTWEPRDMLLQDGFGDVLKVVDKWVEAGRKEDFFQFVSELYPSVAGANPTGTCLFLALQQALGMVGEPTGVTDEHIEEFLSRSNKLNQDLSRGISWRVFRAFVMQIYLGGSRLSMADIEFNRHRTGHRGIDAVKNLELEDGIYLVAASNTMSVGHAFVLQVCGSRRLVYDDNTKRTLVSYGEWIDRVMLRNQETQLNAGLTHLSELPNWL
ncbi:hypothetical protein PPTG_15570 [Phytophthora nicotianae INRA-310]|uniref:Chromo domain-containing protein n=1 Tax=Phytophthora nicotianae (strain INRA-310) TaxID=761204 RepID=W2PRM8_PHYN3|nr:hypothetical protein PPTG_15570 [Phytophthora nicotianae INRA-310]ETN03587.1 hypothetical protein PPTG_15570 [Phytophthora nicotianae INRA-310]